MYAGRLGRAVVGVLNFLDEELDATRRVFGADTFRDLYYLPAESVRLDDGVYPWVVRCAPDRFQSAAQGTAADFLEDYRPAFILALGVAGGVCQRDDVAPGDVIIPDYVHYPEIRKNVDARSLPRYVPYDQPSLYLRESIADPIRREAEWRKGIASKPPKKRDPRVAVGSLLSGEKMWGDYTSVAQQALLGEYTDAIAVDTESYGVARAVYTARRTLWYNPQYLVVRGVSDLVDGEGGNNAQRRSWKPYAAEAAAVFAHSICQLLLSQPDLVLLGIRQGVDNG